MRKYLAILLALTLLLSGVSFVSADAADPVRIEAFMMHPWVTSEKPDPEIDIYKKWFDEKFGIDYVMMNPADGKTELLTRMTAGNEPDLIGFGSFSELLEFYDQGVLIEDWNPYLDQMPDFVECMGQDQINFYTRDGKLLVMAPKPGEQHWGWMIRKDWLAALGKEMPTSMDELYDTLYAFTYDDPDGNGENDTYGITSAGGGSGIGELSNLCYFFGRNEWYIDENGEVTHGILTGAWHDTLDFIKKLYDNGCIDPNWYTQGWEERKSALFAGEFGMCWYPPLALYEESLGARQDEAGADWWQVLPMFQGKLPSETITGASRLTVSDACASDPAKMEKICAILNVMNPLHEEYYQICHGVDFDGYRMNKLDDGTNYIWKDAEGFPYVMRSSAEGSYISCAVYAQFFRATSADGVISGATPEPDAYVLAKLEQLAELNKIERCNTDDKFLTLDQATMEEANMVTNEFTLNYILGTDDNYDAYVENWLAAGGDALKEQAIEQFTGWGLLK